MIVNNVQNVPACECSKNGICPTNVLKQLQTIESIENYIVGKEGATVFYAVDAKVASKLSLAEGTLVEIPCMGFSLTRESLTSDGQSWRLLQINGEKPEYFSRSTIQSKSVRNEVNRVEQHEAIQLATGPQGNGAVDNFVITGISSERLERIVRHLNYTT